MIKELMLVLIALTSLLAVEAQPNITFRHLNTSQGLSYTGIIDMTTDRQGNLWIGTGNGLNMFNGKTVEKYFDTEHPELQNSYVTHVTCDHNNRIWVLTQNGNATIIDEKRKFHRLGMYKENKFIKTRWILKSQNGTSILLTSAGYFALPKDANLLAADSLTMNDLQPIPITGYDTIQKKFYKQVFYYDDDNYLLLQENAFFKINFRTRMMEGKFALPHATALIKWGEHGLLFYDREEKKVKNYDLLTHTVTYPFENLKDQYGQPITGALNYAEKISVSRYLFTTQGSGIYIYDSADQQLYRHTHNVADITSLANDITTTIQVGTNGWIFFGCNPNGISYFNSNDIMGNQISFVDDHGKGYDGLVEAIATDDNIVYYIGTMEGVLVWTRNTNTTRFLSFKDSKGELIIPKEVIHSITIDSFEHVWIATYTNGIVVIDKNDKLLRHIKPLGTSNQEIKLIRAVRIEQGMDGMIWAWGRNGICRINPFTYEVDNFSNTTLSRFDSVYCASLIFIDPQNIWFCATNQGVFHYNLSSDELKQFNTSNGLVHNGVWALGADRDKNIYVGTPKGLNIIHPNGRIKLLTKKDGLLTDRAEGLLLDSHNRMWIGNDIGIACYNPVDSSLVTFDTRYGLSIFGFRVNVYIPTPNGEFALGTPRGIQYFHPDSLFNKKIYFPTLIHKIETKDIVSNISSSEKFNLSSGDRQVTFHFNSVDFSPYIRTYYEYKLSGVDENWVTLVNQNAVRYNSLPPGEYVFKVRVSNDNKHWQDAENEVTIHIASPFYERWWFILVAGASLAWLSWNLISRNRKKQLGEREQLETESVINYLASQINVHKHIDDMLWDMTQSCISRLNLEECVVYVADTERNVLIQKAAYGPKNKSANTIFQPIEIAFGEGITGSVAQSGKGEIVNNTDKDPRYIVDDDQRLSEMAVPIIVDGEVFGVIDSEHSKRNYFTPKHLNLMTTIAILTANQIQRIQAEEEKQKAEIEILQNKQKATESRLQSLRLQMNPHFLFNALNSIQQMILANEEMVATRYLSRFSKLLRSILIHSDKEMISLKEELDILKLYVELESVRFKEAFSYDIICDVDIDCDEVKIPTLLIQPFVENAIWHGLMHKEGMRNLKIEFTEQEDYIHCIIEDNGIGRHKAKELKISTGQDKKHTSKGIEVSLERLKSMQKNGGQPGTLEIHDLVDANGTPCGTRIEIHLPIQN